MRAQWLADGRNDGSSVVIMSRNGAKRGMVGVMCYRHCKNSSSAGVVWTIPDICRKRELPCTLRRRQKEDMSHVHPLNNCMVGISMVDERTQGDEKRCVRRL